MSDGYAASGYPMPGFPDVRILLRKEAEPGVAVLVRYEIPDRPTAHPDGGPIVGYRDGFPRRENPFALARGWLLRATGPQAERERGIPENGLSTADRVRAWYRRVPKSSKIDLRPPGYLPVDDPLLAHTNRFERFVTDECILTLIVHASRGNPGVGLAPVRFAVQPEYNVRVRIGDQRHVRTVRPIEELRQLFELYRRGHIACTLKERRGMTLQEAAVGPVMVGGYSYPTLRYPSLTKSLSASPNDMWARFLQVWQASDPGLALDEGDRKRRQTARQVISDAYQRLILHHFLRGRRLVPTATGHPLYAKTFAHLAWLNQLARFYRFDERGCPAELDEEVLVHHGVQPQKVRERQLHRPAMLKRINPKRRGGALAQKWGKQVYRILGKRLYHCMEEP